MNGDAGRGGRYVLWGARRRDVQIGGVVDRTHQAWYRIPGLVPWTTTKRGKRIGW